MSKTRSTRHNRKGKVSYHCTNLKFLIDFFNYLGITPEDYGILGSTSAQCLREQLRADDLKISKAMTIAEELGYTLSVSMKPEDEDDSYVVVLPPTSPAGKRRLERLAFLENIMLHYHLSHSALAAMVGCTRGAVASWLRKDDMKISYVIKLKNKLNLTVKFIFKDANSPRWGK